MTGKHHSDEEQFPVHAAVGFRALDVHKEIHLFTSYLFQV